MNTRAVTVRSACIALLLACAARAHAGDTTDIASLIRSMSHALRTLDYEGTFVHLADDNLTSLRIVHSNDGRGELERLSALDGEAREVFRDHSLVTCIWPDSRSVVVSSSKPRSPLPAIDASLSDNRHYRLSALPDDRVAGRSATVIEVAPVDALRYGYRFWLDSDNTMLLRSMLLDEGGRALEQLLFTHIEFPDEIDPARFEISGKGARSSWIDERMVRAKAKAASVDDALPAPAARAQQERNGITFEGLPDGYGPLPAEAHAAAGGSERIEHIMLGDGMASVSVYVERSADEASGNNVGGPASMGAVNAYGLKLDDAFVTALGEVPADTVRLIAHAVRISP